MPDIHLFVVTIQDLANLEIGLSPEVEAVLPEVERQVVELAYSLISNVEA